MNGDLVQQQNSEDLLFWYSTSNLRFLISSLYALHASPARVRSAVKVESFSTTFEAV